MRQTLANVPQSEHASKAFCTEASATYAQARSRCFSVIASASVSIFPPAIVQACWLVITLQNSRCDILTTCLVSTVCSNLSLPSLTSSRSVPIFVYSTAIDKYSLVISVTGYSTTDSFSRATLLLTDDLRYVRNPLISERNTEKRLKFERTASELESSNQFDAEREAFFQPFGEKTFKVILSSGAASRRWPGALENSWSIGRLVRSTSWSAWGYSIIHAKDRSQGSTQYVC